MKRIGQADRSFNMRYKEYVRTDIRAVATTAVTTATQVQREAKSIGTVSFMGSKQTGVTYRYL
jgi:hypothetical protein